MRKTLLRVSSLENDFISTVLFLERVIVRIFSPKNKWLKLDVALHQMKSIDLFNFFL